MLNKGDFLEVGRRRGGGGGGPSYPSGPFLLPIPTQERGIARRAFVINPQREEGERKEERGTGEGGEYSSCMSFFPDGARCSTAVRIRTYKLRMGWPNKALDREISKCLAHKVSAFQKALSRSFLYCYFKAGERTEGHFFRRPEMAEWQMRWQARQRGRERPERRGKKMRITNASHHFGPTPPLPLSQEGKLTAIPEE